MTEAMTHAITSVLHMSAADFRKVQARVKGSGHEHAKQVSGARNKGHLAKLMISRGGGFSKFVGSALNAVNPWHWASTFNAWQHSKTQNETMTAGDHDMAHMVDQAYKPVEGRTGAHGWTYLDEHSDEKHAVFHKPAGGKGPGKRDQYLLSIRGTADAGDLLPDAFITAGAQDQSADFQASLAKAKDLQGKLKGDWSVGGHSLGGTKAMWVAEQTGVDSFAFNPGFHAAADDIIDTGYKGHNVFLVRGDPVSNSIMARKNPNLKMLTTGTSNPLENHSMSNFVEPTRQTQSDVRATAATKFKQRFAG